MQLSTKSIKSNPSKKKKSYLSKYDKYEKTTKRILLGLTWNGHAAQEKEPNAPDKAWSLPLAQTHHFGTLSLPKNRIKSQLCMPRKAKFK
jgi:hypothetical protein